MDRPGRPSSGQQRMLLLGVLLMVCATFAAAAGSSIEVAVNAREPALRVDAVGNAEISWTAAGGGRRSLLVDRGGAIRYGGLAGADVSHPSAVAGIPWVVVI